MCEQLDDNDLQQISTIIKPGHRRTILIGSKQLKDNKGKEYRPPPTPSISPISPIPSSISSSQPMCLSGTNSDKNSTVDSRSNIAERSNINTAERSINRAETMSQEGEWSQSSDTNIIPENRRNDEEVSVGRKRKTKTKRKGSLWPKVTLQAINQGIPFYHSLHSAVFYSSLLLNGIFYSCVINDDRSGDKRSGG